jgi:DNA-binding beta-propeller fold protein YncE
VSVVDVSDPTRPRVVRTLLVGDEPRDIVFAGPGRSRAFITTAHRGQNIGFDPQLTTPGVGRADVWVFDANCLGNTLGGTALRVITLFSDTPRALAVSRDGSRVYAAAFLSGNRTTTLNERLIPDGGIAQGGLPPPNVDARGVPQPEVGLIVRYDGTQWIDPLGRAWSSSVRLSLPDWDVFAIDANASPPVLVGGDKGRWSGVGTVLYGMVVNPASGKIYVSNTEARNDVRFEPTVRGHFVENRITVLDGARVLPRHLNKHIDYSTCCAPVPNPENDRSLALPLDMAVSRDGHTLYVAAFGSSKIGVFRTDELERDSFVPDARNHIRVSGGGPSGLVIDESNGLLYAYTRFDNALSVIDLALRREIAHTLLHNPEPPEVIRGRRLLYDAAYTSSHGDSACASCHVSGDFDGLAWDLGDPNGLPLAVPGPFVITPPFAVEAHPMKGPMVTQSLRGMANHGPMHWRGDRTGGILPGASPSQQPDGGSFDERAGFRQFNPAFAGLLGRSAPLSDDEINALAEFALRITYPPNPVRRLDNSLTADEQAGRDFFHTQPSTLGATCVSCHVLAPQANAGAPGVIAPGFFGTDGHYTYVKESQIFKIPQLRNLYQKVGMFGMADTSIGPSLPTSLSLASGDNQFTGAQVRGFGYLHDGSVDTIYRFHSNELARQSPTNPGGIPVGPAGDTIRRQLERYLLAFDTNLAPVVGQQVTLTAATWAVAGPRIDLLVARAERGECDLIAKADSLLEEEGLLYAGRGAFRRDRAAAPLASDAGLRWWALGPGRSVTYTCVPLGSGLRLGLDRDGDGRLDGDERDIGSDPANPG